MDNLFGIGILFELKDNIGNKLRGISRSLEDAETQAEQTTNSINSLQNVLQEGSSFQLTARETQRLNSLLEGTSREAENFNRRMMQMSHHLGGEMTESTRQAYATMQMLNREVSLTSRQYGRYSQETLDARNRLTEFALALNDTTFKQIYMRGQLGLTTQQLQQQANGILLNARMTKLMTNQLAIMDERMRGLQKLGIKPEHMIPPSTPGVFDNLNKVMSYGFSPLNNFSLGFRTLGANVEKTIKGFSAQKQAIKLANGDMVKYNRTLMNIQGTLTDLAIALPIVGGASILFYSKLYSVAYETNTGFKNLVDTVKEKLLKAFEPLIQVAIDVGTVFLNLVSNIADLVIKFNEAHPVLARILAVIGFLVPALTTLSLTVVAGVGIWRMWMIALANVWPLIRGVVAMIGTASSTALALASIISVLVVGLTHLWKTNETFRNIVIGIWEKVKEVVGGAIDYLVEGFTKFVDILKNGGLEEALNFVATGVSNLANTVATNLPILLQKGGEILSNIVQGIQENLPKMIEQGKELIQKIVEGIKQGIRLIIPLTVELITNLVTGIATYLPMVLETGSKILEAIIQGITNHLPKLIAFAVKCLIAFVEGFINRIMLIAELGILILQELVKAIENNLPQIMESARQILEAILTGIMRNLGILLDAGLNLIQGLIEAITQNLPMLVEVATSLITQLATFITDNLPLLIDLGLQILTTIISGILENIPLLITTAVTLMTSLVQGLLLALPQLIMAGIELITQLAMCLVENAPLIVGAIVQIVTLLIQTVIGMLPQIIALGIQLLVSLVSGLLQAAPQLLSSGIQLILDLISNIASQLPQFLEKGREIVNRIKEGIINAKENAKTAMGNVVDAVKERVKQQVSSFVDIGKSIIEGLARGIANGISSVVEAVGNVVDKAIQTGRKLLGINSPSRVFKQIGAWTSEGLSIGIDKEAPKVIHSVEDMTNDSVSVAEVKMKQTPNFLANLGKGITDATSTTPTNGSTNTSNNNFTYNITINADNKNLGDDPKKFASEIYKEIKRLQQLEDSMNYKPTNLVF